MLVRLARWGGWGAGRVMDMRTFPLVPQNPHPRSLPLPPPQMSFLSLRDAYKAQASFCAKEGHAQGSGSCTCRPPLLARPLEQMADHFLTKMTHFYPLPSGFECVPTPAIPADRMAAFGAWAPASTLDALRIKLPSSADFRVNPRSAAAGGPLPACAFCLGAVRSSGTLVDLKCPKLHLACLECVWAYAGVVASCPICHPGADLQRFGPLKELFLYERYEAPQKEGGSLRVGLEDTVPRPGACLECGASTQLVLDGVDAGPLGKPMCSNVCISRWHERTKLGDKPFLRRGVAPLEFGRPVAASETWWPVKIHPLTVVPAPAPAPPAAPPAPAHFAPPRSALEVLVEAAAEDDDEGRMPMPVTGVPRTGPPQGPFQGLHATQSVQPAKLPAARFGYRRLYAARISTVGHRAPAAPAGAAALTPAEAAAEFHSPPRPRMPAPAAAPGAPARPDGRPDGRPERPSPLVIPPPAVNLVAAFMALESPAAARAQRAPTPPVESEDEYEEAAAEEALPPAPAVASLDESAAPEVCSSCGIDALHELNEALQSTGRCKSCEEALLHRLNGAFSREITERGLRGSARTAHVPLSQASLLRPSRSREVEGLLEAWVLAPASYDRFDRVAEFRVLAGSKRRRPAGAPAAGPEAQQ